MANVIKFSSQPFGAGRPDGGIILANKAYSDLVGYTKEEMLNADWVTGLTPPEHRELESSKLADLIATGKPIRYEKEYLRKDGTRVPVELLVHLDTNEAGEQFYYSFITDLTDRRQAEQALKERQQVLESILAACPIGINHRIDRRIQWANKAWEEMFGFQSEREYAGQSARVLYPSEDEYERIRKLLYSNLPMGVTETEAQCVRRDGSVFDCNIRMAALDPSDVSKRDHSSPC